MENIRFFGSSFRPALLFILLAELLSFFVYWFKIVSDLSSLFFSAAVLIIFIASLIKLEYGLYAALAELFIGSKGYLLALNLGEYAVSLRIGIFCAIMLSWLITAKKRGDWPELGRQLKAHKPLLYLGAICLWGLIFAFARHLPLKNIFFDFNAWLYFLYFLPLITTIKEERHLNNILQIFMAGLTALTIKSCLFLFIFSHKLPIMRDFYKWGRDSGWGEFTLLQGNLYRIFSQAHIFVLIGIFIILGYLIFKLKFDYRVPTNQYLAIILFFSLTTIILSLSRSFWLAIIVTFLCLLSMAIFKYKFNWKNIGLIFLRLGFLVILSYALIVTIINFPLSLGQIQLESASMIAGRLTLSGAAVSSRWSQLPELIKAASRHPFVGSGWGATVTYRSADPRILTELNPQGWYTTFAFEWGYLDLIFKIGLIGLAIYLYFLWFIGKQYLLLFKKNTDRYHRALILGLMLGLLALVVTHGVSPYLNHPLGIGYLLILLAAANVFRARPQLNVAPTKS